MKWSTLFIAGFLLLLALLPSSIASPVERATSAVKELWLFKDVLHSNTAAIKTSGYDTVILFSVNVNPNGDLVYYGITPEVTYNTTVASGGVYTGGSAYADQVKGYKTGTTTIKRTEISLVSGSVTWQSIESLVNAQGTGTETVLYKNFAALKAAWNLDAINDDDEAVYDLSTTVSFATMMGRIGYKFTLAPYTNQDFWSSVVSKVNKAQAGLLDRVYLQCYDGGAYNNPGTWQLGLGMKVIPLLWVTNNAKPDQGKTPAQMQAQFQQWKTLYGIVGGGYWNDYDIEQTDGSYQAYENALAAVFG